MLAYGVANKVVENIDKSIETAIICLNFLFIVLDQIRNEPVASSVVLEISKAAIHSICKWSINKKYGKEIIQAAATILKTSETIDKQSLVSAFENVNKSDIEMSMKAIKSFANVSSTKKRQLKKFSSNTARRQRDDDGEWQDLEIE
ncbi:hypothetical protein GPJ56_000676 [Histomonas meleagridis]|uniref:uncharacterized protein n=1 Tax=Histomonas meleagridis TaxID=135588 RepID=UPI003559D6CE|nr:hypothetical protein GPJ56_000676 [Histomonas meleagridis]KAH0804805.1 hypothetical protein GO595_002499 [Histomonas meleagridis]